MLRSILAIGGILFAACAAHAQNPDLMRDHQARLAIVDKHAQALALVLLCDVELEHKPDPSLRTLPEEARRTVRESVGSMAQRYRRKFDDLAGPQACISALERFGPQGTDGPNLVVEKKQPKSNFRGPRDFGDGEERFR